MWARKLYGIFSTKLTQGCHVPTCHCRLSQMGQRACGALLAHWMRRSHDTWCVSGSVCALALVYHDTCGLATQPREMSVQAVLPPHEVCSKAILLATKLQRSQ